MEPRHLTPRPDAPRDFRIHPLNRRHGRTRRFVVLAALVCVLLGVIAWRAWS